MEWDRRLVTTLGVAGGRLYRRAPRPPHRAPPLPNHHSTRVRLILPTNRARRRSLRLQASEADIDAQRAGYRTIQDSFRCFAVTGQKGTAEQAEEDVAETLL